MGIMGGSGSPTGSLNTPKCPRVMSSFGKWDRTANTGNVKDIFSPALTDGVSDLHKVTRLGGGKGRTEPQGPTVSFLSKAQALCRYRHS